MTNRGLTNQGQLRGRRDEVVDESIAPVLGGVVQVVVEVDQLRVRLRLEKCRRHRGRLMLKLPATRKQDLNVSDIANTLESG